MGFKRVMPAYSISLPFLSKTEIPTLLHRTSAYSAETQISA